MNWPYLYLSTRKPVGTWYQIVQFCDILVRFCITPAHFVLHTFEAEIRIT